MNRRRLCVIGLWIGLASACIPRGLFFCTDDGDCETAQGIGICELSGHCSFADSACASGRRYGEHAPRALASKCVTTTGPSSESSTGTATDAGATVGTSTSEPSAETAAVSTSRGSS